MGNWAYEYDKRGNLIGISDRGKRVRDYDYDITGRLGLSYSKLGKARSYSYDGLGNRIGFKEYEKQIGYGEDGLKTILGANLSELTPSYEENYILDRTRAYHNLLQRRTGKRGVQEIQSYVWDFNVAYMEEGEKEFTYLQDELGSTIRLLGQGEECQAVYGYDEFGEDTYCTQGHLQPFGYTGYRYDNIADTYFAQAREYVPGVGRFTGEDWIKGEIYYPTSLNQYGYCLGNPFGLVDYDGKKSRVPLANPSNANIDNSYKNRVIEGANANMVHWYQEVTGDYKPLDKGEMYYADVSASLSASIYKPVDFEGEFDALYTYNILKGGKLQQPELAQEPEKRLHLFRS